MNDPASTCTPNSVKGLRIPHYRLHRTSGQAVVTIRARDIYLGTFGSEQSRAEYDRIIAEYIAARGVPEDRRATLGINEFCLAYWRHAQAYYPSATANGTIKPVIRRFRKIYGNTRVADFGPLKLKAFRETLLRERDERGGRLSRRYINEIVAQVKAIFRWGVSEELVPPTVYQSLATVDGIRFGRSDAPEHEPVRPVADHIIETTIVHLCPTVADMVRVQRLTGMRPGEVCTMSPSEIDCSGAVWLYTPKKHKTAHHGKSRVVPIGPKAQEIIRRYMTHEIAAPVFSPRRATEEQKAEARAANTTPFTPSRLKRDRARARKPRRKLNAGYTTTNYGQAIRRACEAAGITAWSPNQLRHARATELRRMFGLDAAGAVLGHSRLETTQVYAERSVELAISVAMKTG